MKPTLFLFASLAASLAAPLCSHAAPADKPVAPTMEQHNDDDDDHAGGSKINEGSLTDYLWRRSDVAFHAGDFARAVELHRAIVAIDPTDVESYSVGAWLLWSLERGDEATAFIALGLKNNPDNPDMWEAAGDQYGLQKQFARERDAFGKAVELAGADAGQMLRRRYAHASEHTGDLAGSAQVWRDLVQDFPNEAVNKNNLARVEDEMKTKGAPAPAPAQTMGFVGLGALSLLGFGAWKKRASGTLN